MLVRLDELVVDLLIAQVHLSTLGQLDYLPLTQLAPAQDPLRGVPHGIVAHRRVASGMVTRGGVAQGVMHPRYARLSRGCRPGASCSRVWHANFATDHMRHAICSTRLVKYAAVLTAGVLSIWVRVRQWFVGRLVGGGMMIMRVVMRVVMRMSMIDSGHKRLGHKFDSWQRSGRRRARICCDRIRRRWRTRKDRG